MVESYNVNIKKQENQAISLVDIAEKVDKPGHRHSIQTPRISIADIGKELDKLTQKH